MPKKIKKISNEYFGIILEDINSKFDIIKKGQLNLSEKFDRLEEKVDRNYQEFIGFRDETRSNFKTVLSI
ncbi:MAG: hypothetical protein GWO87_01155 [Xanthomonadaceae bacterium]|nr:hypothetical protein [Rhodospirillaceae bacterium]NIA17783.1 hypothetical protein [Xanthomonadaceae bacterium]